VGIFLSIVIKVYFLLLYINNLCINSTVSPIFNIELCEVLQLKALFTTN